MGAILSGDLKSPIGKYKVVGRISLKFDSTPLCKIFFPISSGVTVEKSLQEPYTRTEVVEGMARATGLSLYFLKKGMGRTKHSFATEGVLAGTVPEIPEDLPLVFFSHGLFGTSDHYCKVCGDLASNGAIVVAFEHADGSGSYANVNGESLDYEVPPKAAYTRSNVLDFRGKQLEKREKELRAVMEVVLGEKEADLTELQELVFKKFDRSRIFLAGHSFGGASTLTSAFSFEKQGYLSERIQGYVCLDPWGMPLHDALVEGGLEKPLISIRSEKFAFNDEAVYMGKLCKSSPNCKLDAYMKGIIHEQFSDAPWYMSSRIVRRLVKLEGKTRREKSQESIVGAVSTFLQDPQGFSKQRISGKREARRLLDVNFSMKPSSL